MKRVISFLLGCVFFLFACAQVPFTGALLQTPEDEPRLVIDPQGHSDMVMAVMFTPDGAQLVSVSTDKTIRVWDVKTGDLMRTIRGQIGHGPEGMLYAGALSPDGKVLAVGGFLDTFGKPDVGDIRLINLETGEQIGLLKGHKNVVTALAFSADGHWLASGSGDHTIRIWQIPQDLRGFENLEGLKLEGHTGRVQDIAFAPDGNSLVSASYDGTLRLWELPQDLRGFKNLEGLKSTEMKHHIGKVRCVAYAPNGKYIVSGGSDHKILLWDHAGTLLKELDELNGSISTLAFSADSSRIVAAKQNGIVAYVYTIPAGERIATFEQHTNTIAASTFYGNEWIATAGGDNYDMYIWNATSGAVQRHILGKGRINWAVAFGRGLNLAFGHSETAAELLQEPFEKSLDFSEMSLDRRLPVESEFRRIRTTYQDKTLQKTSAFQLQITGGGLITNERYRDGLIRSYTFTLDGDVVVGSDFSLKLYRANGEIIREFVGHTGTVWAVSIAEDGRILASAGSDQTIKLWNLATGECLATLFVATDDEWVCWTPQGYYAASAGGEKYIGWHLNQGMTNAAQYYPVSVFRKRFHFPELVRRTTVLGNFEKALAVIDVEKTTVTEVLPPQVQWLLPDKLKVETSAPTARIRAHVQSGSPLLAAKVLVNGRIQAGTRGLAPTDETSLPTEMIDQEISLIPGRNEIMIFASNEDAAAVSEKRIVFYQAEEEKPTLYMASIGISKYRANELTLRYADNDAQAMSQIFRQQVGRLYRQVNLKELYDLEATQAQIKDTLAWLQQHTTQHDVAIMFIAAHGTNEQGTYYLMPTDVDLDNIAATGISWQDFAAALGKLPARVLLFLDTCQSGQLGQDVYALRKQVDNTEALRELASDEYGVVILAASTGREFSLEDPEWGHGAFTKALIEALEEGKADYYGDGFVDLRELDLYVAERVASLTDDEQHPTTQKPSTISRFTIVQVKD